MPIVRTLDDSVAVLSLELGRGNAIDHAFIDALGAALDETARDGARAVVLTGRGKVFCGGLDLLTIHAYDRAELERFVDAFEGMFTRVLSLRAFGWVSSSAVTSTGPRGQKVSKLFP